MFNRMMDLLFRSNSSKRAARFEAEQAINLTIELCIEAYGKDNPRLLELIELNMNVLCRGYIGANLQKQSVFHGQFEFNPISTNQVFSYGGHVEWNQHGNLVLNIINHLGEHHKSPEPNKSEGSTGSHEIDIVIVRKLKGSSNIDFTTKFSSCDICKASSTGQMIERYYVCSRCKDEHL